MFQVSTISKMKSTCGFSLFGTALVLYISKVLVIADYKADCIHDVRMSDTVADLCFDLDKDILVGDYVTAAADRVYESVRKNCNASVERICDKLPKIVVTSNVGGKLQCKYDLREIVCDKDHFSEDRHVVYCQYFEAVKKIITKPDKWNPEKKDHICKFIEVNPIICYMAVRRLCDRISSVLVKNYCQEALEKGICSRF